MSPMWTRLTTSIWNLVAASAADAIGIEVTVAVVGDAADGVDETIARAAGVETSEGTGFGPGGEGHVRLNFATSPALLEEIVSRMASALR